MMAELEQAKSDLSTDLAMRDREIESVRSMFGRKEKDLEAKMTQTKSREGMLNAEIKKLKANINALELKHKEQHRRLKRYKHHEEDIMKHIETMKEWNTRMRESSLQYLGGLYPQSSNKELFELCQKGCVSLLEATYTALDRKRRDSVDTVDGEEEHTEELEHKHQADTTVSASWVSRKHKRRKETKMCRQMMTAYSDIFRSYLKTTINYASLQQAHNGVVEDFKVLKQDFNDIEQNDGNTLEDDALIMAARTASLF